LKSRIILAVAALISMASPGIGAAPLEGRVSLGYTSSSGNTDEQQSNFNFDLTQKRSENLRFGYNGLAIYGRANGKTNNDKQNINLVSEFIRNDRDSYYLNTGLLKDRFAGYDQQLNVGLGFYRYFVKEKHANLRGSLGVEITDENYTDNTTNTLKWLKFGLNGNKKVGENIKLISSLDLSTPNDDYRNNYQLDTMFGGLCSVNSRIDVEVKYLINYRKTPLVAGKEKQDSSFLTSLVYKM